ncbi:MAG: TRAP transporter permease [Clostridiales bacterium]|nr:TRAP transporter permease [Clostridiales bacterium]
MEELKKKKEMTEAPEPAVDGAQVLEEFDKESRTRSFVNPVIDKVFKVVCLIVTFYHLLYASGYVMPETLKHRSLHVGMILVLAFAMYPASKKASRTKIPFYDYILMALSAAIPIYMWTNYLGIIDRVGSANQLDVIFGTILILLVMEAARRISGITLPILGLIFMIYALMGAKNGLIPINVPGIFKHRGYGWTKLIGHLFSNTEGIYGTSVNVASTYIFLFIVFGEVMNKCGMGAFFNDIANAIAGHSKGGPAKVSVLASGFLGSINGSAIANVVTTGAFTIPLMKKTGYSKEFAGAVEATASVGGQLLPPIMGAAAFIMAETLGVKYSVIIVSAAIPALIYYLGIIIQIQLRASKEHLEGLPKDKLPKVGEVMKRSGHLLIPIVFLLYMLFFSGFTVIKGAFLTVLFTIVIAELRPSSRMSLTDILDAFIAAAKSTVSVAVACACVGIVIGVCSLTGFALNMASAIIKLGGQSLLLTLLFTMVTCMILGMGLPSIPAYLITATIAAPALIELGIPAIAAHMFCFYFAMFANLTPPVALAAFAAAGLSGGNPMKTGFTAVKLALAGFIVPYMFVYNTELLLLNTSLIDGIRVAATACVGVFLISAATEGFLYTKVNPIIRVVMLVGAFLLITSSLVTDIAGIVIGAAVILFQKMIVSKRTGGAATA